MVEVEDYCIFQSIYKLRIQWQSTFLLCFVWREYSCFTWEDSTIAWISLSLSVITQLRSCKSFHHEKMFSLCNISFLWSLTGKIKEEKQSWNNELALLDQFKKKHIWIQQGQSLSLLACVELIDCFRQCWGLKGWRSGQWCTAEKMKLWIEFKWFR